MSIDLQQSQRLSITQMLQLKTNSSFGDVIGGGTMQWKVLIYDKFCQDIIAPVLRVIRAYVGE